MDEEYIKFKELELDVKNIKNSFTKPQKDKTIIKDPAFFKDL